MPIAQLISPQALDARKEQPGLVILDCRFALEDPDYGQRSYAEGHIAGAHFADLERDLEVRASREFEQAKQLVGAGSLGIELGLDGDDAIVVPALFQHVEHAAFGGIHGRVSSTAKRLLMFVETECGAAFRKFSKP